MKLSIFEISVIVGILFSFVAPGFAYINISSVIVNETAFIHTYTDESQTFRMRINATSNESITDVNLTITFPSSTLYKIPMTLNVGNNTNGSWNFYYSNFSEGGKHNFTINLTNNINESILYQDNFSVIVNSPRFSQNSRYFPSIIRRNNTNATDNGTTLYTFMLDNFTSGKLDRIWMTIGTQNILYTLVNETFAFYSNNDKWIKDISFNAKFLNTTFLGLLDNRKFNISVTVNNTFGNKTTLTQEIKYLVPPLAEQQFTFSGANASLNYTNGTYFGLDVRMDSEINGYTFQVNIYPKDTFDNYSFLGLRFYEISANNFILSKLINATIRFYYNDSELGTINESSLRVRFYNESSSKWENISSSSVNTTSNFVQAVVTHLSSYSVGGEDILPITTTTTIPTSIYSGGGGSGSYRPIITTTSTIIPKEEPKIYSWSPYENEDKWFFINGTEETTTTIFPKPKENLLEGVSNTAWLLFYEFTAFVLFIFGIGYFIFWDMKKQNHEVKRK